MMSEAVSKNVFRLLAGSVLLYLSGQVEVLERYIAIGPLVAGVLIVGLLISGLSIAAIALYRLGRR
jgi:hypothetical protein